MDSAAGAQPGLIAAYMTEDHRRLDGLRRAEAWWEFRGGLLRHIGLEEKILLPEARRRRGGSPLPDTARLRKDHGALATLLVPKPSPEVARAIDQILARHNAIEEGPDGVYAQCDALAGADAADVVERLRAAPAVPQNPYQDGPRVQAQVERVLAQLRAP